MNFSLKIFSRVGLFSTVKSLFDVNSMSDNLYSITIQKLHTDIITTVELQYCSDNKT